MGGKNNKMKITVKKKKELIIYSDQIHSRFLINSNRGPPKPQKDCNFTIKFGFCCRFPFPFPFPAVLQVRVGATPPVIPETYLSTHHPFRTHLNQSKCFNVISLPIICWRDFDISSSDSEASHIFHGPHTVLIKGTRGASPPQFIESGICTNRKTRERLISTTSNLKLTIDQSRHVNWIFISIFIFESNLNLIRVHFNIYSST